MQEIKIPYRRFWFWRHKTRQLPQKWEELSTEQLIAVAENYLGICDDNQFLAAMCNVRKRIIRKLPSYFKYKIGKELEFLSDYTPYNNFIIKRIASLYAPKYKMEGVSFGQFMFADTFYSNWCSSGSDDDLNKFIACLYLPKDFEFDSKYLDKLSKRAARISTREKYAITLNYRLIKEWLPDVYPLIFDKADKGEKKKKRPSAQGNGWIKIFESIVGDDIVNQDKYARLPMHQVLKFVTNKIKEHAKK